DIAVCSWSLQPSDTADLIGKISQLGLSHVQLSLAHPLPMDPSQRQAEIARIRDAGLIITAGMMHFDGENYKSIATIRATGGFIDDETWPARLDLMHQAGELAAAVRILGISVHAGFIPSSAEEKYDVMLGRLREVANPLAARKVNVLLET